MAIYLVTYDLKKPGQDYSKLLPLIKSATSWAKLSESSYAIDSPMAADDILTTLRAVMDANDTIYVIPLHRPYSGFGPTEVNQWLAQNLQSCQ